MANMTVVDRTHLDIGLLLMVVGSREQVNEKREDIEGLFDDFRVSDLLP